MASSDSRSGNADVETLRRMRDFEGDMSGLCEACGHSDCARVGEVQVGEDDYMMVCPSCLEIATRSGHNEEE